VTVDRDPNDAEVIAAFESEVSAWRPTRVPDLLELTRPLADSWQRPVMLASALGAAALAVVLVMALVVVTAVPADIGWAGTMRDHLTHMP
jgi:hypothetical protein